MCYTDNFISKVNSIDTELSRINSIGNVDQFIELDITPLQEEYNQFIKTYTQFKETYDNYTKAPAPEPSVPREKF